MRYIGVTHYVESAHDRLLDTLKQEQVDFVQFNYSVSERNAEKQLLPYCADHGIATLINRPFTRGNLLSKVRDKPLPDWAAEIDASSGAAAAQVHPRRAGGDGGHPGHLQSALHGRQPARRPGPSARRAAAADDRRRLPLSRAACPSPPPRASPR